MGTFNYLQICIAFFVALDLTRGVKINKLQVPSVIRHDAPVLLDCDFTLEPEDEGGLVVKWFFTKNQTLVYQWIQGHKPSQGSGIHKDRLDLHHEVSRDDNSRYRALHILKPGPDLSGDYTCSVSTFQSEDRMTKSMLVFVPGRNLRLRRLNSEDGVMHVQCSADGVFPRPVMILRSQEREISVNMSIREKDQLFEISSTTILPALQDPEEFSCELHIPQANHTVRRTTVFYPGTSKSNTLSSTRWLTIFHYLLAIWVTIGHSCLGW